MRGSFARKRTPVALADDALMAVVATMLRAIKMVQTGLVKALLTHKHALGRNRVSGRKLEDQQHLLVKKPVFA